MKIIPLREDEGGELNALRDRSKGREGERGRRRVYDERARRRGRNIGGVARRGMTFRPFKGK